MTDKELRKLNRAELLEILLEQTKRVEALQAELELKNKELENRKIMIDRAGSIAEASLRLNEVFEAAQRAADQYLENAMQLNKNSEISKEPRENITDETVDFN